MKTAKLFLCMSAVMLGSASIASAQTWSGIPSIATTGAGTGFWNNASDDRTAANLPCNIGGVLTGAPGIAGCTSQGIGTSLPFAIVAPTQYLSNAGAATAFFFGAGSWDVRLLGTVTGSTPPSAWRMVEVGSGSNLGTILTAGNTSNFFTSTGFYLTIDAWAPTGSTFRSDALNGDGTTQFAAFGGPGASSTGNQINWTSPNQTYFVGMEDNACASGSTCPSKDGYNAIASDRDFNDIMLQVTSVPEPSSIALVAAGLAGLAFASRRRRSI
jgi:hypothetical protein